MDRRKVKIVVFNGEQYDDDWPTLDSSTTLLAAIAWFNDKLIAIPEEYRESASCEIDSAGGWEGSHYGHIEIWYNRPETDEEMKSRAEKEAKRADKKKREELATLAALKAKYP